MASEVDIANLALAHLGDSATVATLDPPEGSVQAEHCARFYPIARDGLLEMHSWGFSTRRVQLAQLGTGWPEWEFAYAMPADALNILAVLPPGASDDYSTAVSPSIFPGSAGNYVPQNFSCEIDGTGTQTILTDQENAVLRYTCRVTDTTQFSPLFVTALSWHLASMLAGPLIKGETGAAEGARCGKAMMGYLSMAKESDAGQRRVNPPISTPWITGR